MKIEPFVYVLGAGLLIILAGLLVSGELGISIPGLPSIDLSWLFGAPAVPAEKIIFSGSVGQVGATGETYRHIRFGDFLVGWGLGKETIATEENITIQNGVFAHNTKTISFSGKNATAAVLNLTISETNGYGELLVVLNGKVIRVIDKAGDYAIEIKYLNSEDNVLVIDATSSGMMLWAPTTYIITNLNLGLSTMGEQVKTIPFTLYEQEILGWSSGRLYFLLDSSKSNATGNLVVKVNGNKVYEGVPTTYVQKDFSKLASGAQLGENIITFEAAKGATYSLTDAELIMFYFGTGKEVSVTKTFSIGSYMLSQLVSSSGQISFGVEDVYFNAGLNLTLNNQSWSFSSLSANTTYYSNFTSADVLTAGNQLKFTTSGAYKIGDVKIKVV